MERWWFNSMVFKKELKRRYGIKKSMHNLGPIENTSESEYPNRKGRAKNIHSWGGHDNSSYSNVSRLFAVNDIRNFSSDETFLVRDSNGDSFSIYFDIENKIFEIENDHSFLSELESSFFSYRNFSSMNSGSTSEDSLYNHYMYDTQSSWNNHITSCIDSYLQSQICIDTSIESDSSDSSIESDSSEREGENDSSDSSIESNSSDTSIESDSSEREGENDSSDSSIESNSSDTSIESDSSDSSIESNSSDSEGSIESDSSDSSIESNSSDSEGSKKPTYAHLWVRCDNEDCYGLNYKKFFLSKMNICEHCGYHLKMSSSERIEVLIDPGTWDPMDEDMVSLDPIEWDSEAEPYQDPMDEDMVSLLDPIEFDSEEEPYQDRTEEEPYQDRTEEGPYQDPMDEEPYQDRTEEEPYQDRTEEGPYQDPMDEEPYQDPMDEEPYQDRIDSYQKETGLTEAIQTGVGQLNGIPIAIGVMDFQFMGGSMGSAVGEKITRLIEYATNQSLPLIIVCASGGARMQEGSLSLMQMAKISSALYDYQSNQKLFYVSILTSPTTGGVTASFGMLGDIIIAEPNAYIAFAGKRVIEQTLNITVPEGSQEAENLFHKGLVDLIVPRNDLKSVLTELLKFHAFFPLNSNSIK